MDLSELSTLSTSELRSLVEELSSKVSSLSSTVESLRSMVMSSTGTGTATSDFYQNGSELRFRGVTIYTGAGGAGVSSSPYSLITMEEARILYLIYGVIYLPSSKCSFSGSIHYLTLSSGTGFSSSYGVSDGTVLFGNGTGPYVRYG